VGRGDTPVPQRDQLPQGGTIGTLALPLDVNAPGIVGGRSLRCLQLIRIGRHPSQVMLLPAQGLWVVSGRGPEAGSNGAGKTVLLGALSLLLGDPQWSGGSGTGPSAARLLFDHDRARATDSRHKSASHGYIAGVFCNAKSADPVSVWLLIERHSSPYVQVRWADGIHLAEGGREAARIENADARWKELRVNGTLSVTEYAARLYGDMPRCLASIRARGSEDNQDRGLLALGQRSFRPVDLASHIITLAGKRHALDAEQEQRVAMQENQQSLDAQKTAYQQQYQREEAELAQIARRKEARRLSKEASEAWASYLTLLCLLEHLEAQALHDSAETLDYQVTELKRAIAAKQEELRSLPSQEDLLRERDAANRRKNTAIQEKEKVTGEEGANRHEITTLENRISTLVPSAKLALGMTVAAAETAVSGAKEALEAAQGARATAQRELASARDSLTNLLEGTGGPAGPAVAALRTADINAVPLLDLVTLPESGRSAWEGRLSPYDRAIVISVVDANRARTILAAHPGTPVIVCDGPVASVAKTGPGDFGLLGDLLRRLKERMPEATDDWIEDRELALAIGGGYDPPLTDREAAIAAARSNVDRLRETLNRQDERHADAIRTATGAEGLLTAARAAAEITALQVTLAEARRKATSFPALIAAAREQEEKTRQEFISADAAYTNAAQDRQVMRNALTVLRFGSSAPGGAQGLSQLAQEAASAREKAFHKRDTAESLRQVAGLADLAAAEAALAHSGTLLDQTTMHGRFHTARRLLRKAIEEVLAEEARTEPEQTVGDARPLPVLGPSGGAAGETHHMRLSKQLREFHGWCDVTVAAEESARPFDLVEHPLRSWLDWTGSDDEIREHEILQGRIEQKAKIAAAERKANDTLLLLQEAQRLHIDTIDQMFRNTERTLRDLLDAVGRDQVALRPRHTDVDDAHQWLRWEVFPQWLPAGRKPVDYHNPPNTAELIILHLLLAASALVSATVPRGRMLILDESGNNLDAPNLRRVSHALKQIAEKYGLTMVLACQDLYTSLVSEHSASVIQLVRSSPGHVLNAPPVILQEEDDPVLVRSLTQYLQMGRPTGHAGSA
jgi:hypothetical protein